MSETAAKGRLQKIGETLKEFRREIENIDQEISAKNDERETLRLATITREEAMAILKEDIDAATHGAKQRVAKKAGAAARGRRIDRRGNQVRIQVQDIFELERFFGADGPAGVDNSMLLYLLRDRVLTALRQAVDEDSRFDAPEVMPAPEREARIKQLDQEIEKLELERAKLTDQIREAGFHVDQVYAEV